MAASRSNESRLRTLPRRTLSRPRFAASRLQTPPGGPLLYRRLSPLPARALPQTANICLVHVACAQRELDVGGLHRLHQARRIDGRLRVRRRPRTGSSAPTGRLPRPLRKGTPWGAIPRGGGFGPRRVTIGAQPKAPMRQHLGEATMCLLDIRQRLAAQTSELACLIPMAGLVTLIPLCRGV